MAQFLLCPADKARQPPTVFVGQAAVGQHLSAVQNDRRSGKIGPRRSSNSGLRAVANSIIFGKPRLKATRAGQWPLESVRVTCHPETMFPDSRARVC
jgi:hypothetical protein